MMMSKARLLAALLCALFVVWIMAIAGTARGETERAMLLGEVIVTQPPPSPAPTISKRLAPLGAIAPGGQSAPKTVKPAGEAVPATANQQPRSETTKTSGGTNHAALRQATVKERIDGGALVFLHCEGVDGQLWIAVPKTAARPGDTIRFADSTTIAPFTSQPLRKTFASVTFPDDVSVIDGAKPDQTAGSVSKE